MDELSRSKYLNDIEYFSRKVEADPSSKLFMPLAVALLKLNKYDDVIYYCSQGLEHFPDFAAAKTVMAQAYMGKGRVEDAKGLLKQVILLNRFNYKANKLMGDIYRSEQDISRALDYYEKAWEISPEDRRLKDDINELRSRGEDGIELNDVELPDGYASILSDHAAEEIASAVIKDLAGYDLDQSVKEITEDEAEQALAEITAREEELKAEADDGFDMESIRLEDYEEEIKVNLLNSVNDNIMVEVVPLEPEPVQESVFIGSGDDEPIELGSFADEVNRAEDEAVLSVMAGIVASKLEESHLSTEPANAEPDDYLKSFSEKLVDEDIIENFDETEDQVKDDIDELFAQVDIDGEEDLSENDNFGSFNDDGFADLRDLELETEIVKPEPEQNEFAEDVVDEPIYEKFENNNRLSSINEPEGEVHNDGIAFLNKTVSFTKDDDVLFEDEAGTKVTDDGFADLRDFSIEELEAESVTADPDHEELAVSEVDESIYEQLLEEQETDDTEELLGDDSIDLFSQADTLTSQDDFVFEDEVETKVTDDGFADLRDFSIEELEANYSKLEVIDETSDIKLDATEIEPVIENELIEIEGKLGLVEEAESELEDELELTAKQSFSTYDEEDEEFINVDPEHYDEGGNNLKYDDEHVVPVDEDFITERLLKIENLEKESETVQDELLNIEFQDTEQQDLEHQETEASVVELENLEADSVHDEPQIIRSQDTEQQEVEVSVAESPLVEEVEQQVKISELSKPETVDIIEPIKPKTPQEKLAEAKKLMAEAQIEALEQALLNIRKSSQKDKYLAGSEE
jgi:tetratricopeptide (TPR) repeat protein